MPNGFQLSLNQPIGTGGGSLGRQGRRKTDEKICVGFASVASRRKQTLGSFPYDALKL